MEGFKSRWQKGKRKWLVCASVALFSMSVAGCWKASAGGDEAQLEVTPAEGQKVSLEKNKQSPKEIVVAKVNGTEINMDSLLKMMNRISAKSHGAMDQKSVEEQALNRLILVNLAYQQAQEKGLKADEKNVVAAMANLKTNLGGEEGYEEFLAKEELSEEELKAQISRSLTLEVAYAREVYNKVIVPEDEVVQLYEEQKDLYVTAEKMRVVDVLFLQQDTSEAVEKKAEEVLRKIKETEDRNPWELTLDGTFLVRSYDVDKERNKELYEAGRQLEKDQLSGVIKTAQGLHIIKLKEYSPARQLSLDEVRGRIENSLRVPGQDRRLKEWEQELRKEAKIEIVWPGFARKDS